jgi:hypothetical protein
MARESPMGGAAGVRDGVVAGVRASRGSACAPAGGLRRAESDEHAAWVLGHAVLAAEQALPRMAGDPRERLVQAGDLVYALAVEKRNVGCRSPTPDACRELAAAGEIDALHGRVVQALGMREWPQPQRDALLPSWLSPNLTARLLFVGIALHCSTQTPEIGRLLQAAGMRCGREDAQAREAE